MGTILALQLLSASLLFCMQLRCSRPSTHAETTMDKHDFVYPVIGCMLLESCRHNNETSLGVVGVPKCVPSHTLHHPA